jgi:hypothetical protein
MSTRVRVDAPSAFPALLLSAESVWFRTLSANVAAQTDSKLAAVDHDGRFCLRGLLEGLGVADIGGKANPKDAAPARLVPFRHARDNTVTLQRKERERLAQCVQLAHAHDETFEYEFDLVGDAPRATAQQQQHAAFYVMQRRYAPVETKVAIRALVPCIKMLLVDALGPLFRPRDQIVIFLENGPLLGSATKADDDARRVVVGFTTIYSIGADGKVDEDGIWRQQRPPNGTDAMRWVVAIDARIGAQNEMGRAALGSTLAPDTSELRLCYMMRVAWLFCVIYHEVRAHVAGSLDARGLIGRLRAQDRGIGADGPTRVPSHEVQDMRYILGVNYLTNELQEHRAYALQLSRDLATYRFVFESCFPLNSISAPVLIDVRTYLSEFSPLYPGDLDKLCDYAYEMLRHDLSLLQSTEPGPIGAHADGESERRVALDYGNGF